MERDGEIRIKATNKKAFHDYEIEERLEAGIALTGSEIKSIREGRISLRDAYAAIEGGELFLFNSHIAQYEKAGRFGHDEKRPRKLLLHKKEIERIFGKLNEKGYTLIPLRVYIRNGKAKVELGLARGRRKYDKRREIAKREAERQIERALSRRRQ
ncbi:MAG: SsrA-binding protein SmpB [Actinomycetota bacterium]|nr:SsrA-binding protein SmpB [Actinomycetota bacterium]